MVTIDADGYMHITDRTKDVIKSGGEWISSIETREHRGVAPGCGDGRLHRGRASEVGRAATAGRGQAKPGAEVTREQLLAFYDGKVAKWQMPDDVVFVESIPLGATGKMLKNRLREQFKDYRLPGL